MSRDPDQRFDLAMQLRRLDTQRWRRAEIDLIDCLLATDQPLTAARELARLKAAGYSASYIDVEILPFTTADKADRFSGWDSINSADVKVATTLGTTFEKSVRDWFPNAEIMVVEAPARGFQEVLSGRADAFITSNIEGSTLLTKFPNLRQIEVSTARAPTPIAMLLPQADQVWINYVNSWIELKKKQGFFETTAAKWGL